MNCPYCNSSQTVCSDSRQQETYRRRRYKCLNCEQRFTTHEIYVESIHNVVAPIAYTFNGDGSFTMRRIVHD